MEQNKMYKALNSLSLALSLQCELLLVTLLHLQVTCKYSG